VNTGRYRFPKILAVRAAFLELAVAFLELAEKIQLDLRSTASTQSLYVGL